jgi:hypothetical protein
MTKIAMFIIIMADQILEVYCSIQLIKCEP